MVLLSIRIIYTLFYRRLPIRLATGCVSPTCIRWDGEPMMNSMERIITLNRLTEAIINSYKEHNITKDDAQNMAHHVLNFFGFGDRIVDNILEPEDRDLFYMLEDFGLLVTEREETTLYDGREWRIHYWLLKKNTIHSMACRDDGSCRTEDSDFYDVYDEIPDEIWSRND
jgi:hypothetical protein